MKKLILVLPFVFAACSQEPSAPQASADQQPAAQTQSASAPVVGGDKDEHGCIGSAGYTYSAVSGKCVRLWEDGIALVPVIQGIEPSLVAYVIKSKNDQQAEVFVPDVKKGIVLSHATDPQNSSWADPDWMLTYDAKQGWKLSYRGILAYASKAQ